MAIYDILCGIKDTRNDQEGICTFNGYVEDYLSLIGDEDEDNVGEEKELFTVLFEQDNNLKVVKNLHLDINKHAIANQIIRYKDAFKLAKGSIVIPYVIYGMFEGQQKAIILTIGGKEEHIFSKALYYVLSEPNNEFEGTRNEIISLSVNMNTLQRLNNTLQLFFKKNYKAGSVQRRLDTDLFEDYHEMYGLAKKMAEDQKKNALSILKTSDDHEKTITNMIVNWFLLKKFTYVQYMMDKSCLNEVHGGNVKKQRQVAKEKSDRISFISYSELWILLKNSK